MSAFNIDGKVINVGDRVSIIGLVISFTGTGSTAMVSVQPNLSSTTFLAQANDMNATQHSTDANHPLRSFSGKAFGAANDDVTVLGVVTAISGSGNTATLTVTLATSGLTASVPAGACHSDNV